MTVKISGDAIQRLGPTVVAFTLPCGHVEKQDYFQGANPETDGGRRRGSHGPVLAAWWSLRQSQMQTVPEERKEALKIVNSTHYESAPLILLARRVAADELEPEQRKRARVEFRLTTRGRTRDGRAGFCPYVGSDRCVVYLARNPARVYPANIAHILAHEMAHMRGLNHAAMRRNPHYRWIDGWHAVAQKYIDGITITVKPRPVMTKTDETKLANAMAKVLAWQKKKRRAETGIKVWTRRVRYYEKKAAAKRQGVQDGPSQES